MEANEMLEGDSVGVVAQIPKRQKLNIVGIGKVRLLESQCCSYTMYLSAGPASCQAAESLLTLLWLPTLLLQ